ncbi:4430_t:CDS:2, partial [Ambispora gerdemannii]
EIDSPKDSLVHICTKVLTEEIKQEEYMKRVLRHLDTYFHENLHRFLSLGTLRSHVFANGGTFQIQSLDEDARDEWLIKINRNSSSSYKYLFEVFGDALASD